MIWWENRTLGEVVFHAEYGFITKSCENLFWCITDLYARFDADWTYSDPNCFTTLNQDCLTKLPFYMWNTLDSRKTHNLPTKSRASTTFSNQLLPINPSTTKNVKHSYSSTKHSWFLHQYPWAGAAFFNTGNNRSRKILCSSWRILLLPPW